MKKNQVIKILIYCLPAVLLSLGMPQQTSAMDSKNPINTNLSSIDKPGVVNDIAGQVIDAHLAHLRHTGLTQDMANAVIVDTLFTNRRHLALKPNIRQKHIAKARVLVNAMPVSPIKKDLIWLLFRAQYLFQRQETIKIIYAMYRDGTHTAIRDNLSQKEITRARSIVDNLCPGKIKTELKILAIFAQHQFASRQATYALFSDGKHTKIKNNLTQTDIDKAKELVDSLIDECSIKADLNKLIILAQEQLDKSNAKVIAKVSPAEKVVYELFSDNTFTKLAPGVNKYIIQYVRDTVKLAYPTKLNRLSNVFIR